MVNETAGAVPAPGAETGPVLALQNVYLKDCSYEAPSGPRLDGNWNPQINLDLHTAAAGLSPELTEVVLTVTVAAKQNDATTTSLAFVKDVLFPYARAAVSYLVTQGGFPQFLLPPVNFDALYAQNQGQQTPQTTN